MAIAQNLSSRSSGRNNRAITFTTVWPVLKYAVGLLLGLWLVYQIRRSYIESQVNNKQLPDAVVQERNAGLSNSNRRTGPDETSHDPTNPGQIRDFLEQRARVEELYKLEALLNRTRKEHQRRMKEFKALLHGKDLSVAEEDFFDEYQRRNDVLDKLEALLKRTEKQYQRRMSDLHAYMQGKGDGDHKIDEKQVLTANIQTEPNPSKLKDGDHSFCKENELPQHVRDRYSFSNGNGTQQHVHVNKIDEKGELTKMKANIQTEPDQSNGVHSFSDYTGIPQHVHHKYSGMESTDAETETPTSTRYNEIDVKALWNTV